MKLYNRLVILTLITLLLLSSAIRTWSQGKVLADSGFRPAQHGFSFENYGNDNKPVNLTPEKVRELFGDSACKTIDNGTCVLSASSASWMDKQNKEMSGGHCEGMAVLSTLIFNGTVKLHDLDPNAQSIADLKADDPKVQAE